MEITFGEIERVLYVMMPVGLKINQITSTTLHEDRFLLMSNGFSPEK